MKAKKAAERGCQMKTNPTLVSDSQPFSRNANKRPFFGASKIRPFSSEIPNRFLKHDFRVENSYLCWERVRSARPATECRREAQQQGNVFWDATPVVRAPVKLILSQIERGDPQAAEKLLPPVY